MYWCLNPCTNAIILRCIHKTIILHIIYTYKAITPLFWRMVLQWIITSYHASALGINSHNIVSMYIFFGFMDKIKCYNLSRSLKNISDAPNSHSGPEIDKGELNSFIEHHGLYSTWKKNNMQKTKAGGRKMFDAGYRFLCSNVCVWDSVISGYIRKTITISHTHTA